MAQVWIVLGYDVGGNSGETIEGVFSSEAEALAWAENSPHRKWNNVFGENKGAPFDVEGFEVFETFADALRAECRDEPESEGEFPRFD